MKEAQLGWLLERLQVTRMVYKKVVGVKIGDSWVGETTWNHAVKANQTGTASEAQKKMLQVGHFQAK